jgi:hypothetical protein
MQVADSVYAGATAVLSDEEIAAIERLGVTINAWNRIATPSGIQLSRNVDRQQLRRCEYIWSAIIRMGCTCLSRPGAGSRAIMFIHGLGFDHSTFAPAFAAPAGR